jgi:carbonic anhydrase
MIDYVFRYDPSQGEVKPPPSNAEEARRSLIEGNRVFSEWMADCGSSELGAEGSQYVVSCGGLRSALLIEEMAYPTQKPFAVVLGCSDARVPTEMLFGQGFNDLFVVRVAGHVLDDSVLGTIDFSIQVLSESVKVLVVLGHTHCGAVTGAVDTYLDPKKLWSKSKSPFLRQIYQRTLMAVRESDNALRAVWSPTERAEPAYRAALIDMAVSLNAAQTAFALRQQVEQAGNWDIDVLFGVYDLRTRQVCMPLRPDAAPSLEHVNLAYAPSHPREFAGLAGELAEILRSAEETRRLRDGHGD